MKYIKSACHKKSAVSIVLLLIFTIFYSNNVNAKVFQDFEYSVRQNDSVIITGYHGTEDILKIPQKINEKFVIAIADHAFSGNGYIKSVTLPDMIRELGKGAFEYCDSLDFVYVSGNIKNISAKAFKDCSALDSAYINKGTETIEESAFEGDSNLQTLMLSDSVTHIKKDAFKGCSSISYIGYCGTEEQWNSIIVEAGNESLYNAAIIVNYGNGDPDNPPYQLGEDVSSDNDGTSANTNDVTSYSGIKYIDEDVTTQSQKNADSAAIVLILISGFIVTVFLIIIISKIISKKYNRE